MKCVGRSSAQEAAWVSPKVGGRHRRGAIFKPPARRPVALCLVAALALWGCKSPPQAPRGDGTSGSQTQTQTQRRPQPQPQPQPVPAPTSGVAPPRAAPQAAADAGATADAARLASMVNAERARHGLPPVPFSRSLTRVAELHVRDLQAHPRAVSCNMHSWSAAGAWMPCCYTSDHAQARCMWNKPAEITGDRYRGSGFEISMGGTGRMTPELALIGWRGSAAHYAVIMNQGIWASSTWRAMGVEVSENYAVVWFGTEVDPDR